MHEKTVYLHIGMPKTGSTAIQGLLYEHADELELLGYTYPRDERFFMPWAWAHHPLAAVLSEPFVGWVDRHYDVEPRKLYEALRACVKTCAAKSIVVSSELFGMAENLWRVPRLLPGLKIHVICYFRWQHDYLRSLFRHAVIMGGAFCRLDPTDVAVAIEHNSKDLDYFQKAESLSAVFGRDNVTIRIFDRSVMHRGDVGADFLHTLGVGDSELSRLCHGRQTNAATSGDFLELKSYANDRSLWDGNQARMERFSLEVSQFLQKLSGHDTHSEMFERCFPVELRQQIVDRYVESNAKLVDHYLDGKVKVPTTARPSRRGGTDIDLRRMAQCLVAIWQSKDDKVAQLKYDLEQVTAALANTSARRRAG